MFLQSNEDWLLADVHQSGVLFSPEDVQDVVKQVMGFQRCADFKDCKGSLMQQTALALLRY